MSSILYTLGITALLILAACTKPNDIAIPRRTAYPRAVIYDSVYTQLERIPLHILKNTNASDSVIRQDDGAWWLTVKYPIYRANIYCTLTPVDAKTAHQVYENREERIQLNLGTSDIIAYEKTNPTGYSWRMYYAPDAKSTPVQFIATNIDNPEWIISGTTFLEGMSAETQIDSIMPIIEALKHDVLVMLNALGNDCDD